MKENIDFKAQIEEGSQPISALNNPGRPSKKFSPLNLNQKMVFKSGIEEFLKHLKSKSKGA